VGGVGGHPLAGGAPPGLVGPPAPQAALGPAAWSWSSSDGCRWRWRVENHPPWVRTAHLTCSDDAHRSRERWALPSEGGWPMTHLLVLGLDSREDAERVVKLRSE